MGLEEYIPTVHMATDGNYVYLIDQNGTDSTGSYLLVAGASFEDQIVHGVKINLATGVTTQHDFGKDPDTSDGTAPFALLVLLGLTSIAAITVTVKKVKSK